MSKKDVVQTVVLSMFQTNVIDSQLISHQIKFYFTSPKSQIYNVYNMSCEK